MQDKRSRKNFNSTYDSYFDEYPTFISDEVEFSDESSFSDFVTSFTGDFSLSELDDVSSTISCELDSSISFYSSASDFFDNKLSTDRKYDFEPQKRLENSRLRSRRSSEPIGILERSELPVSDDFSFKRASFIRENGLSEKTKSISDQNQQRQSLIGGNESSERKTRVEPKSSILKTEITVEKHHESKKVESFSGESDGKKVKFAEPESLVPDCLLPSNIKKEPQDGLEWQYSAMFSIGTDLKKKRGDHCKLCRRSCSRNCDDERLVPLRILFGENQDVIPKKLKEPKYSSTTFWGIRNPDDNIKTSQICEQKDVSLPRYSSVVEPVKPVYLSPTPSGWRIDVDKKPKLKKDKKRRHRSKKDREILCEICANHKNKSEENVKSKNSQISRTSYATDVGECNRRDVLDSCVSGENKFQERESAGCDGNERKRTLSALLDCRVKTEKEKKKQKGNLFDMSRASDVLIGSESDKSEPIRIKIAVLQDQLKKIELKKKKNNPRNKILQKLKKKKEESAVPCSLRSVSKFGQSMVPYKVAVTDPARKPRTESVFQVKM